MNKEKSNEKNNGIGIILTAIISVLLVFVVSVIIVILVRAIGNKKNETIENTEFNRKYIVIENSNKVID